MQNQQPLREQLVKLLQGGQSYTPMRQLLTGIPFELAGKRVYRQSLLLRRLLGVWE